MLKELKKPVTKAQLLFTGLLLAVIFFFGSYTQYIGNFMLANMVIILNTLGYFSLAPTVENMFTLMAQPMFVYNCLTASSGQLAKSALAILELIGGNTWYLGNIMGVYTALQLYGWLSILLGWS